jgi:hypothetical protein
MSASVLVLLVLLLSLPLPPPSVSVSVSVSILIYGMVVLEPPVILLRVVPSLLPPLSTTHITSNIKHQTSQHPTSNIPTSHTWSGLP